jgi:hypothetical protein
MLVNHCAKSVPKKCKMSDKRLVRGTADKIFIPCYIVGSALHHSILNNEWM